MCFVFSLSLFWTDGVCLRPRATNVTRPETAERLTRAACVALRGRPPVRDRVGLENMWGPLFNLCPSLWLSALGGEAAFRCPLLFFYLFLSSHLPAKVQCLSNLPTNEVSEWSISFRRAGPIIAENIAHVSASQPASNSHQKTGPRIEPARNFCRSPQQENHFQSKPVSSQIMPAAAQSLWDIPSLATDTSRETRTSLLDLGSQTSYPARPIARACVYLFAEQCHQIVVSVKGRGGVLWWLQSCLTVSE